MKLRHVLLLACALGACGALILAWDMHKRLKTAESALLLSGTDSKPHAEGSKASTDSVAPAAEQANISMFSVHSLGLLSLAFLFLAVFLLLISALRERAFAFAIDGEQAAKPPATPSPAPPQVELPVVMALSEAAEQEVSPAEDGAIPGG